jgi:hypothetical protein
MSAWTDLGALATGGALAFAVGGGIAMLLAQLPARPQSLAPPRYGFEPRVDPAPRPPAAAPTRPRVRAISVCDDRTTPLCCGRPALAQA